MIEQLRPNAEAFTHIKERATNVEFEAHVRAQQVLDDAEIQVSHLKTSVEEWMRQVSREYATLRGEMDTSMERAEEELKRVHKGMEKVGSILELQDRCLETGIPLSDSRGSTQN